MHNATRAFLAISIALSFSSLTACQSHRERGDGPSGQTNYGSSSFDGPMGPSGHAEHEHIDVTGPGSR